MKMKVEVGKMLPGGFEVVDVQRGKYDNEFRCSCPRCGGAFWASRYRIEHKRIICPKCDRKEKRVNEKSECCIEYSGDYVGLVRLCAAIINTAVGDYKLLGRYTRTTYIAHQQYALNLGTQDDLVRFFNSQWFEDLLGIAYPSGKASDLRKILKIPEAKK